MFCNVKEDKNNVVFEFISYRPNCSSMNIFEKANTLEGPVTIKRILQKNVGLKYVEVFGKGKNSLYNIVSYF